ncbi:amine oxidase [Polychaeton citri CBS 116435]|uniref:Amine oxidase n=1 Tax=Polychaeton citri CBS 116435 TaxID=1314669 RepID=A0A9P4Q1W5_9PEZI|nr:amine oxidase [Polychaeton citri CBS 116435]
MQNTIRSTIAKAKQIHVGIVGAGFAGLRCADVLLKHGCKVTILEARNRVGGRVAQSNHLGHLVDLGPNWIHGTDDNPIMELARETGTKLHAWDEQQAAFNSDGALMGLDEANEFGQLIWDDGLISDAFKYSNESSNSIDPQRSLFDYFKEKVASMFDDLPAETAKEKRAKLLQMLHSWGAYVGSPVWRQSLRFFWLEECIEGENPFVAETYHKILDAVAKSALASADIKYNTVVRNIQYAARNSESDESPLQTMETQDGEHLGFDEVVVTVPLGCLKKQAIDFNPALPPRLSSAISNIGYGALDKVYITFPSAFWNTALTSDSPRRTSLDPTGATPNVEAKSTAIHQAPSSSDTSTNYPGFTSWLEPDYAASTNPSRWDHQGGNLAALSGGCAHPTFLFYTYGDCSVHIGKLVEESKTDAERDAKLVEFFQPYFSRLPNFDERKAECKPKAVLATAWAADQFAGYGSYSNFQVGLEKADEDIEIMRHGVPDQGLWFAGEHTAPFVALGTSTGAYLSGERVAERICQAYSLKAAA